MILLAIVAVILFVFFALVVFRGAPYVPTHKKVLQETFDELQLKKGSTVVDLGSGDGVLLKFAAQNGYKAVGYEINPILCLVSYFRCFKYRKLVKIYWRDFWLTDLPYETTVVYVFLADAFMQKFKQKMLQQSNILNKKIIVVSNGFKIPGIGPDKVLKGVNIYKIG